MKSMCNRPPQESHTHITTQYVLSSPECSELFFIWKNVFKFPLIAIVAQWITITHFNCRNYGSYLNAQQPRKNKKCKHIFIEKGSQNIALIFKILKDHMKHVYGFMGSHDSRKAIPFLKLLIAMIKYSPNLAKETFSVVDWSWKVLITCFYKLKGISTDAKSKAKGQSSKGRLQYVI
jgi:hypothetical protein